MTETIAAIATGLTPAGIGIVRISGPESYTIISKIFRGCSRRNGCETGNGTVSSPLSWKPNRIHYGFIKDIDEVLVMNMRAPHSYTGEDTIEINCHGGPYMMRRILDEVLNNGARLAEPGEFTKRAFLNGRIDLAQAEAVIDIINSTNDNAARASVAQLKGSVSEAVKEIRHDILGLTAFVEAVLDDPEHYSMDDMDATLGSMDEGRENIFKGRSAKDALNVVSERIEGLIATYKYGRVIREGINTCILGKPNAGKSSLLNALLGEERAIVTDIPGTTRDVITESLVIDGLTLNIMDTAGIRETEDAVEKIGVRKAYEYAAKADLVIYVIDSTVPMDEDDVSIMKFINEHGIKAVYVVNKIDSTKSGSLPFVGAEQLCCPVSALTGEGISALLSTIRKMFESGDISYNSEAVITNERHEELLKEALRSVKAVIDSINAGMPEDFYTIDLMDAYKSLGLIIGEETEDDLADRIFADFCMGK